MTQLFGYYIDLNERGSFIADVRNQKGEAVFEIRAGNELGDGEASIFDDGYMRDKDDLSGLSSYLVELGIIEAEDKLLAMEEFERALGASLEDDHDDACQGMRP
ncbi:hypothetical protein [Xanthomonas arboricola]|uniref:Uncharacterized protein n=1 Tax=Xanthomonas arboricola TaxID=56448 RepID=A0AB73H1Q6_9XANT|nr:hypothetical protein [Xanthomonas arboricola]MBB5672319.1 hypothetical protein [Xanthomonas arboricola]